MAKHMKAGAVKVKLQFHGKRPELHVVFPVKFTEQLYRRLRNRFANPTFAVAGTFRLFCDDFRV